MVQLRVLSGSQADNFRVVRRFPFHVGRAADNDLAIEGAGIWDYHFVLQLEKNEGFILQTFEQAFAAVNDQPQTLAQLHNGDIISFGSAKVQFWLAAPKQHGLHFREWIVWLLLILVTASQVGLIWFLFGL